MINKHKRNKKQSVKKRVINRSYKNYDKYYVGVFRSNLYTNAYLMSPEGKIVKSVTSKSVKSGTKSEKAFKAGEELGKYISDKKITNIYFNRSGYEYHGRVKSLCDGIRNSGVKI